MATFLRFLKQKITFFHTTKIHQLRIFTQHIVKKNRCRCSSKIDIEHLNILIGFSSGHPFHQNIHKNQKKINKIIAVTDFYTTKYIQF